MTGDNGHSRFEPVRFDLASLDLNQLDAVMRHLERHGIYYEERGSVLTVPSVHADGVRQQVDAFAPRVSSYSEALGSRPLTTWRRGPDRPRAEDDIAVYRVAALGTRPIRWLVDLIAVGAVFTAIYLALAPQMADRLAWAIGAVASGIVVLIAPTAEWGRTPGGLVTSTVVLAAGSLERPGWVRSVVRWVVPQVPALCGLGAFDFGLGAWALAAGWWVAGVMIYGWILVDDDRRGVHDIVSRTTVFSSRPTYRPPEDLA